MGVGFRRSGHVRRARGRRCQGWVGQECRGTIGAICNLVNPLLLVAGGAPQLVGLAAVARWSRIRKEYPVVPGRLLLLRLGSRARVLRGRSAGLEDRPSQEVPTLGARWRPRLAPALLESPSSAVPLRPCPLFSPSPTPFSQVDPSDPSAAPRMPRSRFVSDSPPPPSPPSHPPQSRPPWESAQEQPGSGTSASRR